MLSNYILFFHSGQVLLYMMDGLLTPANTGTVDALEKVFVFCMIWAMGSSLTVADDGTDYQKFFSDWWRSEWKKVSVRACSGWVRAFPYLSRQFFYTCTG